MVTISGKQYEYRCDIRDDKALRESFDALAKKTFGLSFEPWYQSGWWRERYTPHVLLHNGRVVANVSVNTVDVLLHGKERRYIQLGTVMTDKKYRSRGLARYLMETVTQTRRDECDGMYLYANDTVLDFYPRFGFRISDEYQYTMPVVHTAATAVKLDMGSRSDTDLLLDKYRCGNPFSALQTKDCGGLLMFYCLQSMRENVYYCKQLDAVVIASFADGTMTVYDVFGGGTHTLAELLSAVAVPGTQKAVLGFSPKHTQGTECRLLHPEDTTLFVCNAHRFPFDRERLLFPLLSHA